ncbi:hypothetical protein HS088_TW22G00158 [Tripterygium wilfordii]|uniref:Uncharacterized protein n=1 Tax=Tripterygium wilfordii TaxID=458696 RepID=A0A7J7BX43_TRIWF|nr:uncharacterized protein LOC119990935 [Tripterygium wilfordii]KAF5726480.1 hypothetical protein HS088_TW22G00158 [Tripterygium wilfordii]
MKKKLYKNGKIHPSPITDRSSLLPATILTLTTSLSLEDREVLAYLISWNRTTTNNILSGQQNASSKRTRGGGADANLFHSPVFECNCFRCYMSFWARWDASPNHQIIHEIIEAYEEGLFWENRNRNSTRRRKERVGKRVLEVKDKNFGKATTVEDKVGGVESVEGVANCGGGGGGSEDGVEDGSVRKIVSFIGEKIWGVWKRDSLDSPFTSSRDAINSLQFYVFFFHVSVFSSPSIGSNSTQCCFSNLVQDLYLVPFFLGNKE